MLTIDDDRTKDMDDAIEVEETPTGWLVRVAIADASRLVTPGSELDQTARKRGSTVYFGAGNSPMLPRDISEVELSLWPKKRRSVLIVEIQLAPSLEFESTKLSLDEIESEQKLSYKQIPGILTSTTDILTPRIQTARKLALGLLRKRRENGALVFYDLNNGWVTTEEGSLKKLKDHTETIGYIIIQELMVLANTAVALYAVERQLPMLFRNHEPRANTQLDKAEIQKFIDDAAVNPVIDLEAFQHRTHRFFQKADYGPKLLGHAGLSVKAYTHFTSPIRRYADLMIHQQLRAHLKGESLPHTEEDFAAVATHLNELALKARESDSAHFKGQHERRAVRAVESRKLDGLVPKQFERVVKVEVRSGEAPSEALTEAWIRRLADSNVPTICMATVLMHGLTVDSDGLKRETIPDGWDAIKAATIAYLVEHTPDALSILAQTVALGWPAVSLDVASLGQPHAPRFVGSAGLNFHGETVRTTANARTAKDARQRAAVALLAELSAVPAPVFGDEAALEELPAVDAAKDTPAKHPVSQLMERSQAERQPPPKFEFTMKGESHVPVVTCMASFRGHTVSAVSASKQEAKTMAATLLLGKL